MRNQLLKMSFVIASSVAVSACSGFFDKDNTPTPSPLTSFTPTAKPVKLWQTRAGSGAGNEYLKLRPAMDSRAIYTASTDGTVTAVTKSDGRVLWQVNTKANLLTGPGVGSGVVAVGSEHGHVIALNAQNGQQKWVKTVQGEFIANPAIKDNTVVVKTVDGMVTALSSGNGHKLWSLRQSEPDLVLRGASAPRIYGNKVFLGFANGNLLSAGLSKGDIRWVRQLATPKGAFAVERMIDIDADPIIQGNSIYAATYQGKIAALDWRSGKRRWSHKLSSYTGMTSDDSKVYVSDADSNLWAFDSADGAHSWRQRALYARNISGPANLGKFIVVGDAQGYVHWLNKSDGQFAARDYMGSSIYAKPLSDKGVVYVYSNKGYLTAYTIKS